MIVNGEKIRFEIFVHCLLKMHQPDAMHLLLIVEACQMYFILKYLNKIIFVYNIICWHEIWYNLSLYLFVIKCEEDALVQLN